MPDDPVLWRRDARYPAATRGRLPAAVDVVVVGAGYTGLSAAREFAARGSEVVVLDRDRLGSGASSRNAGFVHPGLKRGLGYLERHFGQRGIELYRETEAAMIALERLVEVEAIECDLERRGYLYLAERSRQAKRLEATRRVFADRLGQPGRLLRGEELAAASGTDRYAAGLLVDNAASVQPAKLHAGLADLALRRGAVVHDETAVVGVDPERAAATVRTSRGTIRARRVLFATNGYTDRAWPWLARRVIPIESFIVATEPLPPDLAAAVSPRGNLCFETKNFLCYWRVSPEGRLVFGGRSSFAPTTVAAARATLERKLRKIYPDLGGVRIETAWGGKVGFTFDQLPHMVSEGPLSATVGCCGGGIALLTYLGSRTPAWLDGDLEPPFERLRFPTAPLYGGKPWFLRPVGELFRLRDLIG